jgi:hypothetical protein
VQYELGVGGLHSKDGPGVFVSDELHIIRDADVGSYYPNIMINNNIRPEHLGEDFVTILKNITTERLAAKKSGEKVKADALKITVNSIFGKLGSETFWLEDARAMLSVTVSGQLYLLMLIESLAEAGIENISANTDGVVSRIPVGKENVYYEICKKWELLTRFELEYTDYKKYIRSDVNNYITEKPDGKTKEKGRFSQEVNLKKGYRYPIVPLCLYNHFIHGKPVDETLLEHHDILDFCISQKTGRQFQMELHSPVDGSVTVLQKNNRFYICQKGNILVKRNISNNNTTGVYVGNQVKILNDYDIEIPFEEYNVDLSFYKREIEKIIYEIEPPFEQTGLFSYLEESNVSSNQPLLDSEEEVESDEEAYEVIKSFTSGDEVGNPTVSSASGEDDIMLSLITEYYDHFEFISDICPCCGSSNIMIMEKWGVCSMCDQSWDISEFYEDGHVTFND